MKTQRLIKWIPLVAASTLLAGSLQASTLGYWQFNGDGVNTPATDGSTLVTDSGGKTGIGTGGILAIDSSGNGNTMLAWTLGGGCGFTYAATSPTGNPNDFSVLHTSWWPALTTWSSATSPSGTDLQTVTPLAWTIQASVNFADVGGNQTIVGRDGTTAAAALYFGTRDGNSFVVDYMDSASVRHQVQYVTTLETGIWYNLAAVSDGTTLSLYNNGNLLGSTDITGTTDASLMNMGDTLSWSIGRGYWNGDVDRVWGNIDEVKIDDSALAPSELLFPVPEPGTMTLAALGGACLLFWRRRQAR